MIDEDRARAPHDLPVRPADRHRAARHPAASSAAFADPHRGLLADDFPADHFINWQQDPFGNYLARVVFPSKASELDITVGLVADMGVINPFDFFIEHYAESYPFSYPPELAADLKPYLDVSDSARGPLLNEWVATSAAPPADGQPTVQFLGALNSAVYRDVAYSYADGSRRPDPRRDAQAGGSAPAATRPGCW